MQQTDAPPPHPAPEAAYRLCLDRARRHYENFPVASWLVPAPMRPHVAAIYAFARTADDFADEGERPAGERLSLLDAWLARLHAAVAGAADARDADGPIFVALAHTIAKCRLPLSLFDDLISAFRQDVTTGRYRNWDELFDYCRRSANPVGRLVLRVAGYESDHLDRASDAVCTALQLTNFWQDLSIDWPRGRLYVPLSELTQHGARHDGLQDGTLDEPWRRSIAAVVSRTRAMFEQGRPICDLVGGRLAWELRFTWLGGMRILDRIEQQNFDVLARRPTLSWRDAPAIGVAAVRWRASPRSPSKK